MTITNLKSLFRAFCAAILLLLAPSLVGAQTDAPDAAPTAAPNIAPATAISGCTGVAGNDVLTVSFTATRTPCFTVAGDNAILNLNGFTVTAGTGASVGVSSSGHTNLIVENGTLDEFSVAVDTSGSLNTSLLNMVIENSTSTTTPAANLSTTSNGGASYVQNSIFAFNLGHGLSIGANSIVTDSISYDNNGNGVDVTGCPGNELANLSHKNTRSDWNGTCTFQ